MSDVLWRLWPGPGFGRMGHLRLILALNHWASPEVPIVLVGDNTGSLQLSLDLNSTKSERLLLRELAWRKAVRRWTFSVAHLPSENNVVADLLSRWSERTSEARILPDALVGAAEVKVAPLASLWSHSP